LRIISGRVGRAFKATRRTSGLGGLEFHGPIVATNHEQTNGNPFRFLVDLQQKGYFILD
jgi:hypothetical protein